MQTQMGYWLFLAIPLPAEDLSELGSYSDPAPSIASDHKIK